MTENLVFVLQLKLKQTGTSFSKNMVLSLVLRSNQDGIWKSNTAPLLAEAIVTDKNSKEHPNNKNNQKDLPQRNRPQIETKLKNQKNKEVRSHSIYSRARASKLCM